MGNIQREFSVSIASDTSAADIHGRITYGDHHDALPHPTHYPFTLVNKKKRATIEDAFDYEKFEYRDPPLAEFRLPAFGLPEHVTSRARSASLRLPAVIAFAAGLLLIVLAVRLRRGRRIASAP